MVQIFQKWQSNIPRTQELQKMVEIPASLDLGACQSVGPVGLVKAAYSDDVKQGLGVLIEMTKALGKLKEQGTVL